MTEVALSAAAIVALILLLAGLVLAARRVLAPETPVPVTVNCRREIVGLTGRKLLNVLKDGGIAIPSGCAGAGTCGLCRVTVAQGGGAALTTEVAMLGRRAVAAGERLACQVVLRGPLSVEVPAAVLSAEPIAARVRSNRMLAPLMKELVLELPEGTRFAFEPGAFVEVTAPPYTLDFARFDVAPEHEDAWARLHLRGITARSDRPVSRAYSLANRPEDTGVIVLTIRLAVPPPSVPEAPPGIVSSWLFGLGPGDAVTVAGPFGDFRARDTGAEMVLIGGGVGMAPLRAIVHDQLTTKRATRPISFWYGARSRADLFYAEEFEALAARHPNFRFTVALSDPAPGDGWTGATGFVHEVARRDYLADHPAPEDCDYYLCGPPLMMRAVTQMLDDLGVEPDRIHFDDFGG